MPNKCFSGPSPARSIASCSSTARLAYLNGPLSFFVNRTVILLPVILATLLALACGIDDYSFKINGDYELWRCNSYDISVCYQNSHVTAEFEKRPREIGPVYQLGWDDQYIIFSCRGSKFETTATGNGQIDIKDFPEPDFTVSYSFITNMVARKTQGPYTANELSSEIEKLKLSHITIRPLDEARALSHKQNSSQNDVAHKNTQNKFNYFGLIAVWLIYLLPTIFLVPIINHFSKRKYGKSKALRYWLVIYFCTPIIYALTGIIWFSLIN